MKGSTFSLAFLGLVMIFGVVVTADSSSSSSFGVPEKSWAVIGYESMHEESKAKKPSRLSNSSPSKTPTRKKTSSIVKKKPVKKVVAPKPRTPDRRSSGSGTRGAAAPPSQGTKAAVGVGTAVAAAAIGSALITSLDSNSSSSNKKQSQRALVKATKKPVVVVTPPRSRGSNPDGASIPNEIFNLVKAIVGVGVLSLPAGVAAFGSSPSAFIPAAILITVIGILSGYGFALIGKVCAYTGATSYRDAWSRTVGEGTSWIPAWSTTCKTFLACLAFSMVLADTFSSLFDTTRNATLLVVTLLILTPLCLMKNLKSLAPFSLLGVLGMTYTAVAMTVRWLDGSYAITGDKSGPLASELATYLRPKFGNLGVRSVFSPNSLILVCMLSTAYMAHFNAPKFYLELKNNTIKRYNSVVSWSFGISIFLMGFITMVGFLTFGKACDGLVLNNYAGSDIWMGFSRIAVAISLVFSYPLAFTGCRDGFLDLAQIPNENRSSGLMNLVTVTLLGVITFMACSLTDVSFVLAFGGATLGNALTYVYPALMYRAVVKQQKRTNEQFGVNVAMISAVLGLVMGTIGAATALKSLQ